MKKLLLPTIILLMLCISSCSEIGGIFRMGAVVGVLSIIFAMVLVIWFASLFRDEM